MPEETEFLTEAHDINGILQDDFVPLVVTEIRAPGSEIL